MSVGWAGSIQEANVPEYAVRSGRWGDVADTAGPFTLRKGADFTLCVRGSHHWRAFSSVWFSLIKIAQDAMWGADYGGSSREPRGETAVMVQQGTEVGRMKAAVMEEGPVCLPRW